MNIEQQLAKADQFTCLWKGLMPSVGIPEQDTLLFWAGKYTEDIIVQAFNRTARKVRRLRDSAQPMTLLDALKYATSIMTHEMLNEHSFTKSKQQETVTV
jgi:hypothetical protein